MRQSNRIFLSLVLCVPLVAGIALSARQAQGAENVIVFLTDDMDWSDLPFFTKPLHWNDPAVPPVNPDSTTSLEVREGRQRRPELNRTAACQRDCFGHRRLGARHPGWRVVPVDRVQTDATDSNFYQVDATSEDSGCTDRFEDRAGTTANCNRPRDILRDHGGLKRLASKGVVFPRMYAASAKCAPTRAAILAGRHINRLGVPDNGAQLKGRDLTIAEFLKQGCLSQTDGKNCYRTALFGKWHLGASGTNSKTSPWAQGFDEYVGFSGGGRKYSSSGPMKCAPVQTTTPPTTMAKAVHPPASRFCQPSAPCTTDAQCSAFPGTICGKTSGVCFYPKPTLPCTLSVIPPHTSTPACPTNETCQEVWPYVGREDWTACSDAEAIQNLACCTRDDTGVDSDTANYDGSQRGRYPFKHRVVLDSSGTERNVKFAFDTKNDGGLFPCNDDGSVLLEDRGRNWNTDLRNPNDSSDTNVYSCLYSERFFRDMGRNFIVRQLARGVDAPGSESNRFFMMIAFHATHSAHVAPHRTRAHYVDASLESLNPKSPGADYWGIIEELDAAIGTIMKTLEGVCSQAAGPDLVGDFCGASVATNPCPGNCVSLENNTLVLFTNDNGSPSTAYGLPLLRGGKESVQEGGIRVGLLAYGPGVGAVCQTGKCPSESGPIKTATIVPAVGSHVDLFATIADAADYQMSDGQPTVNVCSDSDTTKISVPCTDDSDCCAAGDTNCTVTCDPRPTDGYSLLPVLADPAATPPRKQIFASFHNSGEPGRAVISQPGAYEDACDTDANDKLNQTEFAACTTAPNVCAYEADGYAADGSSSTVLSGKEIRGGTCVPCYDDLGTGDSPCNGKQCEILGGVCDDGSLLADCYADVPGTLRLDSDCKVRQLARCQGLKDCLPGSACRKIRINCNPGGAVGGNADALCAQASWKAMGKGAPPAGNPSGARSNLSDVYELSSNPEENERKTNNDSQALYGNDGRLDCEEPTEAKIDNVVKDLDIQLGCWTACVSDLNKDEQVCDCTYTSTACNCQ